MRAQVGSTGEAMVGFRFEQRGAVATLRVSYRDVPGGVDPHVLNPLWDCLDRELTRPSPVTFILLEDGLLGPSHAEALTSPSSPTDRKVLPGIDNVAVVREENFINRIVDWARQIDSLVVTAVHGEVALQLAAPLLAADFRIISEQTTFVSLLGRVELRALGALPWFLARLAGPARATELLLSQEPLRAQDAQRLGLANLVVSSTNWEAGALAKAEHFATLPPRQLVLVKRAAVASCGELKGFLEHERDWI
jgi:Enoyl-CoA hydratase/isomerase